MNMIKRIAALALCAALLMTTVSCGRKEPSPSPEPEVTVPQLKDCGVQHETEFGGVYITIKIDDFNALGFKYGDSVDVEFSNGYKLEDIPYYNGYYVDAGQPLLIAYPGYDYIKAAINYGNDLWEEAGLKAEKDKKTLWTEALLDEHSTATVTLREEARYKDIQEARDIHYWDERERYPSDEVFANFRTVSMGSIPAGTVYRSASPCDNQHNRAGYVDALMKEAGVNCVLDLADTDAKITGYMAKEDFSSDWFLSLYESGRVIPLALSMNYLSDEFASKIADGFIRMSGMEGPYLIHCTEGKDRTGFVLMLLEALAGANYREIADDYMLTYDNYYGINEQSDPSKYTTILEKNLDAMLRFVLGDPEADLGTADLEAGARNYLLKAGMTAEQIDAFLGRITAG